MSTTGSDPDADGTVSEEETTTDETADPKDPATPEKDLRIARPDKKTWQ